MSIAENSMLKFLGINASAAYGFLAGESRQVHRGEITQFAAVAAHGRACATYDCNICSLCHERTLYESLIEQGQTCYFIMSPRSKPLSCHLDDHIRSAPDAAGSVAWSARALKHHHCPRFAPNRLAVLTSFVPTS